MRKLIFTLAAALLMAAPALASTALRARLITPVSEKERLIADDQLWICEDNICVTHVRTERVTIKSCRKFVLEAGPVDSYGLDQKHLDENQLQACNTVSEH